MIFIKQYGAKRTGTNYLKNILHLNFDNIFVLSNILGWKHGVYSGDSLRLEDWYGPKDKISHKERKDTSEIFNKYQSKIKDDIKKDQIRYVICAKNPYAWIDSMIRYLKKEPTILEKECFIKEHIFNWNKIYSSWLTLISKKKFVVIVKYENMISSFDSEMKKMENKLKLKPIDNVYLNDFRKMKRLSDSSWSVNNVMKVQNNNNYYLKEEYLKNINKKSILNINKFLNKDVMKGLGYIFKGGQ